MAKTLPALVTLEKNKFSANSAWLVLLTITLPDATIVRLVRNNEDVTYGGNVFTAFDFTMEPVEMDSKGQLPIVSLKVGNAGRVFQSYIEAQSGIVGSTVLMQIVNSALLAQDFSELDLTFEITQTTADAYYVTFNLGVPSPLNKRFPLYRYSGVICNWVSRFRGVECKYNGADTTCDGRLETCQAKINLDGNANSPNYGGHPGLGKGGIRFV